MRYALLIYTEEPETPPDREQQVRVGQQYEAYTQMLRDRGAMEGGEALQPTTTATTVRVRDGRTLTTDGPFAETKEALGGFYLIDAADLDEATDIAAKIPAAWRGSVEIRPIWELPADYVESSSASEAVSR